MESLVAQTRLLEQRPVVVNNLNMAKPAAGQPTLLSMDEIRTLFHEFGHALHGLLSSVTYPRLAGTAVSKDFVEYPSQVNEMWGTEPELLADYARHVETGEPLPADQIAALQVERWLRPGARDRQLPGRDLAGPGLAPADARPRSTTPWATSTPSRRESLG